MVIRNEQGFSLIELTLILSLIGSIGLALFSTAALRSNVSQWLTRHSTFLIFHHAKSTAISSSNDAYFNVTPTQLVRETGQPSLSGEFKTTNIYQKLGFKSSGTAKYAGTLQIQTPSPRDTLAVSVRGRISLK